MIHSVTYDLVVGALFIARNDPFFAGVALKKVCSSLELLKEFFQWRFLHFLLHVDP